MAEASISKLPQDQAAYSDNFVSQVRFAEGLMQSPFTIITCVATEYQKSLLQLIADGRFSDFPSNEPG